MEPIRALAVVGVLVLMFMVSGSAIDRSLKATSAETAAARTSGQDTEQGLEQFDPGNFDRPTIIDNQWWPLKPGTQLICEGVTVEDDEELPHRIVFTVTDQVVGRELGL